MKISSPNQTLWYSLAMILLSTAVLVGAGIWYTKYATDRATSRATASAVAASEHKWCETLTIIFDRWRSTPSGDADQRRLARALADLRTSFGCDQHAAPSASPTSTPRVTPTRSGG